MTEVYRVGIDVGGTNTDAVIMDSQNRLVAKVKSPTTADVLTGVRNSLRLVLEQSGLEVDAIRCAMLSTTHCTNAITTRRGLLRIACIRLGAPATLAIPPLTTWPLDLRHAVLESSCILEGGHELTGDELRPLNEQGLRAFAREIKGRVEAVAVTAVFSPVNAAHEHRARTILREELGDAMHITLSSEIGGLSLLERENAAALNAALAGAAKTAVVGFAEAARDLGLTSRLFLGQNDGTLISVDEALQFPVLTIASGPANSIRGAAFLSGLHNALVVDIGGTTADLGVVRNGFPRESSLAVEIGGVHTNFRMPDLISIGLGGGSLVQFSAAGVRIGPETVGHRLVRESRVFGGKQLTATDVAVAAGVTAIGDPVWVRDLLQEDIAAAMKAIAAMLERSVDRIRLSDEAVPVVAVGGGSFLFPDGLAGVSQVIRPRDFDVANAVGVSIAEVSATIDRIVDLSRVTREQAFAEAEAAGRERVVANGGSGATFRVVEAEDHPLPYLPGDTRRIRVKGAAALAL